VKELLAPGPQPAGFSTRPSGYCAKRSAFPCVCEWLGQGQPPNWVCW
jgi:hypothetical protein